MSVRHLFATTFYEDALKDAALVAELERSCRMLAQEDRAGRAWAKTHGYRGYTSYASLNDLPQRDPAFGDLVRKLNKHVATFADACAFDLRGGKLRLDSLWVNVLKPGGAHSGTSTRTAPCRARSISWCRRAPARSSWRIRASR